MKSGTCKHFTGIQKKTCGKGICYPSGGLPCIEFMEFSARGGTYLKPGEQPVEIRPMPGFAKAAPCEFRELPTDAEVHEDREKTEASLQKTIIAIKVASEWRVYPKPAIDRQETVTCPICNGNLFLSQSAYNGHVHGQCSTKDCVSWME